MNDKISPRQVQLIQGSAKILMEMLYLTKEEALFVISESLKEELKSSNQTFEYLEIGSLSNRQIFVRNLVIRVEKKIFAIVKVPREKVSAAIETFIKMFHNSWRSQ